MKIPLLPVAVLTGVILLGRAPCAAQNNTALSTSPAITTIPSVPPAANTTVPATGPKPGQPFSIVFADNVTLQMVWIAPGNFTMGSPPAEVGRSTAAAAIADETQHQVTLTQGYWLGEVEVTQAQWQSLMGSNPAFFKNAGLNAPMDSILWDDAVAFCRKVNEQEKAAGRLPAGYAYALPTEAQWEYACRAGTTTSTYAGDIARTPVGTKVPLLDDIAWYYGNSEVTYAGGISTGGRPEAGTHPVGQKKPNAWGLYDMSGNAVEWCADWYAPYPTGSVTDPYVANPPSVRTPSTSHVLRGGFWASNPLSCRSAARMISLLPGGTHNYHGLRLALAPVRDVPPAAPAAAAPPPTPSPASAPASTRGNPPPTAP